MTSSQKKIALVGNPNIGKTTLFNKLCGLSQKTGNYPGVTIDKKKGKFKFNNSEFEVIDLPGINSLYPKSKDEELVINYLADKSKTDFPDKIIITVSALNLKRNLYLFHQIKDLEIPLILAINMTDIAEKRGIFIDEKKLQDIVGCPVIKISAKTGLGINTLKTALTSELADEKKSPHYTTELSSELLSELKHKHKKHTN